MKQRVKVPVKENKEKHQRVYGIHDLLFLPLIIGMAFTKKEDEKRQIDEEVIFSRQQVEDNFNEEIQEVENKLNQITLEANDSKNEDSLDQDNTLLILNIEKKEKFDQLQEEIDDIEKQLFALVIDDKEYIITDDSLTLSKDVDYNEEELQEEKIIEVPQKAIEEYHTWLEELPIQEKFYDIKEKEMEVYSDIILDKETFDLSDYEENQIELKRQIEEVTKTLAKQDKELDKVKTQLALPVSYIEKVNIEVRFTSHILLENLVLTHAISKAKINPVSKLVLQTMVINRTLKQSRRAVRKKKNFLQ